MAVLDASGDGEWCWCWTVSGAVQTACSHASDAITQPTLKHVYTVLLRPSSSNSQTSPRLLTPSTQGISTFHQSDIPCSVWFRLITFGVTAILVPSSWNPNTQVAGSFETGASDCDVRQRPAHPRTECKPALHHHSQFTIIFGPALV